MHLLDIAKKYYQIGEFIKAKAIYHKLLQEDPNNSEILHLLGVTLASLKIYEEAIHFTRRAIILDASNHIFYNSLGNIFWLQKRFNEAYQCYQQSLTLNPNFAEAYSNLAMIFGEMGHLTEAISYFQKALSINDQNPQIRYNLGIAYVKQHQLMEAISCYQQILLTHPFHLETYSSLGKVLKDIGMIDESIDSYQKVLNLNPTYREAFQNFLYTLNFSIIHDRENLFLEHQKFNQQCALPLASSIQPHFNECLRTRRLKIAYLSPDFRKHSLSYFIEPLLRHHDHHQFEIYCYYNNHKVDQITQQLQEYSDHWIDCASFSDEALIKRIRQDQIDILVDLSGHTHHNRVLVLSQKPAPIQVFHTIAYSNTTGLTAIDYRITDHYVDPKNTDLLSSEVLIRMPVSYYCYRPHEGSPSVNSLPAIKNGYITFGSFNSPAKLNNFILSLWAKLLHTFPHAKLSIMSQAFVDLSVRQFFQNRLARLGIDSKQVIISYAPSTEETLAAYHQIDIGLDSYPFNGATTTCQALWMGVPVVTLVGHTPASRAGLSILSAVDLTELITYTSEEYLEKCASLACDLHHLQTLRKIIRSKMLSSPLMDGLTSTRHLEAAYLSMWEKWCLARTA